MRPSLAALAVLIATSALAAAVGQDRTQHYSAPGEVREFVFLSGPKTGTAFSTAFVRDCLVVWKGPLRLVPRKALVAIAGAKRINPSVEYSLRGWGKVVFMVRNPYEMARSGYFYMMDRTKSGNETTFDRPASQWLGGSRAPIREKFRPNETYRAYVHRVSMADGIMATMAGYIGKAVFDMESIYATNSGREGVLAVCLGDIYRAFDKTMQMILRHLAIAADNRMRQCVKKFDPSGSPLGIKSHGTHDVAESKREEAMRIIKDYGAKYFHGLYRRAVALLCTQDGLP